MKIEQYVFVCDNAILLYTDLQYSKYLFIGQHIEIIFQLSYLKFEIK